MIQISGGLLGLLALATSGCVLVGIEPDEIDLAEDETGDTDDSNISTTGTEAGDGDGDPAGDGDGDGDDPTTTGDGDGEPTTTGEDGDGDGDPSGDGDGDGDGDPDGSCLAFAPIELVSGDNLVEVLDGASELTLSCGGAGPETVYRFAAPAAGEWVFTITQSEFDEVLALVDSCEPLVEQACLATPASVQAILTEAQIIYVIVDSDMGTGTATLNVSPL